MKTKTDRLYQKAIDSINAGGHSDYNKVRNITIEAFWDDSDPQNEGWAYRAIYYGQDGYSVSEDSGPVEGTKRLLARSLADRVRKALSIHGVPVTIHLGNGLKAKY